jgi:m7GpppX diphosphatase
MDILKKIDFSNLKSIKKNQNTKESVFTAEIDGENDMGIVVIKQNVITQPVEPDESDVELIVANSRYYKFVAKQECTADISVIYPAMEEDIWKYCGQETGIKVETYKEYQTNVFPNIVDKPVEWINNIFNHKFETDMILYEDDDFVLMPDMKWNMKDLDEMYCLAIVKDSSILCIRELTAKHVPLLEKIKEQSLKTIEQKYGIPSHKVKAYFHYPPTFYHLHIHFNLLNYEKFGSNCVVAHSLVNVISNLKIKSDYYQTVDLEKWYSYV